MGACRLSTTASVLALGLASCASPGPRPSSSRVGPAPAATSALDAGSPRTVAAARVPPPLLTETQVYDVRDNDRRLTGDSTYRKAIVALTSRLGPPAGPETTRRVQLWWYGRDGSDCHGLVLVQSPGDRAAVGPHIYTSGSKCKEAKLDEPQAAAAKKLVTTSPAPRFGEVAAAWHSMLGPPARDDEGKLTAWRYADAASGTCKMFLIWEDRATEGGWDNTMDAPCD